MTTALRSARLAVTLAVSILGPTTPLEAAGELTPSTLWDVKSGPIRANQPTSVAVGPDGHPVMVGVSADDVGFAFVGGVGRAIKYDGRTGAVLWDVTYADPAGENVLLFDVAVGADGDPVAVGWAQDDSCAPGFTCRPFAVKFDGGNGTVRWRTELSGLPDIGKVAIGTDGHPVWTRSECEPDGTACHIKLVKLDGSTGSLIWSTTFGPSAYDRPQGIAVTREGEPVVGGTSCRSDGTIPCVGRVMKWDGTAGAILWDVTFEAGAGRTEELGPLAVDARGQLFVVGDSGGIDETGNAADNRVRVLKLDGRKGRVLWDVTIDLPRTTIDFGSGASLGADGHPLVLGQSCSIPDCDWVTMKLDKDTGAVMWTVTFSPPGTHDEAGGLGSGPDGNPVIVGGDCPLSFDGCEFRAVKYVRRYQTAVGDGVAVDLNGGSAVADGAGLTFARVTTPGASTLVTTSRGPAPPGGVTVGSPATYHDVTTTAGFTGPVRPCFNYGHRTVAPPVAGLRLFRFDGTGWTDVTLSLDTRADVICGKVSQLSTFLLATRSGLTATVKVDPDKWNVRAAEGGRGQVTALIGDIPGHRVREIDVATVRMNGTVPVVRGGDGGGPVLEVKFDQQAAFASLGPVQAGEQAAVRIGGRLGDGTPFEGLATVSIVGTD